MSQTYKAKASTSVLAFFILAFEGLSLRRGLVQETPQPC